ncbi:hypothetical protein V6N13_037352 [Hibiscus sabdariffa]|uniref:Secreted protein n=2 Tax=Hibiscus sabdariffa TaxID=183260 RepID=A0ABR1Z8M8_9ROSI
MAGLDCLLLLCTSLHTVRPTPMPVSWRALLIEAPFSRCATVLTLFDCDPIWYLASLDRHGPLEACNELRRRDLATTTPLLG